MTQPAKRTQKDLIGSRLKQQSWLLLGIIILAALVDYTWFDTHWVIAKSAALGALLNYISQAIFAGFVFWHTGYHVRRNIVRQLYRGQMVKWLLTVLGFALIFITIQPLSAPALFIGFMVMQISHSWTLWRIG